MKPNSDLYSRPFALFFACSCKCIVTFLNLACDWAVEPATTTQLHDLDTAAILC